MTSVNRHDQVLINSKYTLVVCLIGIIMMSATYKAHANVTGATYVNNLSNFNGLIHYNRPNIYLDKETNEMYVLDKREGNISIFDKGGMEIYSFGEDGSLGTLDDLVVDTYGNIILLSRMGRKPVILFCNYRGELISEIKFKNLPPEFSGFEPHRMDYRKGRLYFADIKDMKVVVTDTNGLFEDGYDIASLLSIEEKKKADIELDGFSVGRKGDIFFTIPVYFAVFRLSPDGQIRGFGEKGGAPGKFNIVGGVVTDDSGNIFVADKLKSAILVFDKDFNFQIEFGYRGLLLPRNLIGPNELAIASDGRLYVAQKRSRGVSVFQITYN